MHVDIMNQRIMTECFRVPVNSHLKNAKVLVLSRLIPKQWGWEDVAKVRARNVVGDRGYSPTETAR